MKRATELRNLSSDHHRALVFAKKAKAAASEENSTISDIWQEIEHYYSTELKNHFHIEETYIGSQLESLGKTELVEQLFREHKAIRDFFKSDSSRTADDLKCFGKLLEQHVRFEERELFNVAQASLSHEALASVEKACSK
jgi:hemerythrin-like domain-containing protein